MMDYGVDLECRSLWNFKVSLQGLFVSGLASRGWFTVHYKDIKLAQVNTYSKYTLLFAWTIAWKSFVHFDVMLSDHFNYLNSSWDSLLPKFSTGVNVFIEATSEAKMPFCMKIWDREYTSVKYRKLEFADLGVFLHVNKGSSHALNYFVVL